MSNTFFQGGAESFLRGLRPPLVTGLSLNQDCGAETQISVSCCRHPKLFAPTPERWSIEKLKTIALFVLASWYTKYVCRMGTQLSGSGSTIQKFLTPGSGSAALVGTNCFWK